MTTTPTSTSHDTQASAAPADTRERILRWTGDAVALLLLVGLLWWLERHDGGYPPVQTLRLATLALVVIPVAWVEARRLPRLARWTLAAWGTAIVLSLLTARIRSHALQPALILAVVPLIGLMTRRVWRRSWGPAALLGLMAVAFGLYLSRSFLQWWGKTLQEQQPIWLPLSWRNQAGILMAGFGLWWMAIAVHTQRVVRLAAGLMAAIALGSVWLTSSRGALVVAVVVLVMLVAGRMRRAHRGEALATVVLIVVLAIGTAAGLLSLDQRADAVSPLESRDQSLTHNSAARVEHAQAALRMLLARPLTGHGIGSYRVAAQDFTDPDANLTSSAHNEYAEVLGEGGLALGIPFLLAHAMIGLAAGSLLVGARRRDRLGALQPDRADEPAGEDETGRLGALGPLRRAVQVAGAALVATIGLHAAIDFDWHYLVLPGLLALGAAVLWPTAVSDGPGTPPGSGQQRRRWTEAVVVPVAVVLALGVGAGWWERGRSIPDDPDAQAYATAFAPWDLDAAMTHGYILLRRDEVSAARTAVDRGLAWNPGSSRLATVSRLVALAEGKATPGEVVAALADERHRFDEYQVSAQALIDEGAYEQAATLLAQVEQLLRTYERWGVDEIGQRVQLTQLQLLAARDGCDVAASRAAAMATEGTFPVGIEPAELLRAADTDCS